MHENVFERLWMVESSLAKCMQAFLILGMLFDVDSVARSPPFSDSSDYAVGRELCGACLLRLSLNLILGLMDAVCSFLPFPRSVCTFLWLVKLLMDSKVNVKAVWLPVLNLLLTVPWSWWVFCATG